MDIFIIFIPLLLSFAISNLCPMTEAGSELGFRPPGYVFGIVWTILYLLLGYTWWKNLNNTLMNVLIISLIIMLNTWVYVFSCQNNKKGSIYIMLLCLLLTLILFSVEPLLTSPLLAWLIFALMLNYNIASKSSNVLGVN